MRHKVLIVEDDVALQQMLAWELEDLGYQVTTTGNCGSDQVLFEARSFDLVLLDDNLPDGDGLIGELRRHRPGLPVIMFSGAGCEDTPERALRCGALHFVVKPASTTVLHSVFQKVLQPTKHKI
jgi:DNA-binding response OmpR family regulator